MRLPTDPSRWLVPGPARPGAPRLYCFPHGGGSAAEYVRWGTALPGFEVHAVHLPGRGARLAEPPLTDLGSLVAELVRAVPFGATGPYAFFGHSLGALVAHEVSRVLWETGGEPPGHVVVSAFPAPSQVRVTAPVHDLPTGELVAEVARRHGGLPPEVLTNPALRALAADALRADYRVLETYAWRPGPPVPVPLTVFGGRDDGISEAELRAWGAHTTEPVDVRLFPGGHFYLREGAPAVQRALAGALTRPRRAVVV